MWMMVLKRKNERTSRWWAVVNDPKWRPKVLSHEPKLIERGNKKLNRETKVASRNRINCDKIRWNGWISIQKNRLWIIKCTALMKKNKYFWSRHDQRFVMNSPRWTRWRTGDHDEARASEKERRKEKDHKAGTSREDIKSRSPFNHSCSTDQH